MADLVRTKRSELRPKIEQLKNPNLANTDREQIADQVKAFTQDWRKSCSRFRELSAKIVMSLPRIIDQSEAEFVIRNVAKWEKETIPSIALASSIDDWIPRDTNAANPVPTSAPTPAKIPDKLLQILQQRIDRSLAAFDESEGATARVTDRAT
jgi:hypothetical protein